MPYNSRNSRTAFKRRPSSGGFRGRPNNKFNSRPSGRGNRVRGQYIDPIKFVKAAKPAEQTKYDHKHTFSDFSFPGILSRNLEFKGYEVPSPIQDQTIPLGLEGKDVIGIANTGTGKTAAFALPILTSLIADKSKKALIIAPTRELAQQIIDECRDLAKGARLFDALLIGGVPMNPQLRNLRTRPQMVVGTPGRIKDHLERGTLKLNEFSQVVLDEVDRMLDMGFLPDVTNILSNLPEKRQSLFLSATMEPKIRQLIDRFSKEPTTVSIKTSETSDSVHQDVVRFASKEDKLKKLHEVLLDDKVEKVIIFEETKRSVEKLGIELSAKGFAVDAIHGGKSQGQRQRALNKFKKTEVDILVATDVAARGIDVSDITHVINYGMPQTYEDYTHRVGRAGRAGKTGYALTFIQG